MKDELMVILFKFIFYECFLERCHVLLKIITLYV